MGLHCLRRKLCPPRGPCRCLCRLCMNLPKRTVRIVPYFSEDEARRIFRAAEAEGIAPSAWVRRAALIMAEAIEQEAGEGQKPDEPPSAPGPA